MVISKEYFSILKEMFTSTDIDGTENYIEVVLSKKKVDDCVYDVDFTEQECSKFMKRLMIKFPSNKFFRKHTTKYLYDSLEMSHCNIDNVKTVHNVLFLKHLIEKKQNYYFLINMYDKKQLPNHAFPSSIDINDIVDSKRLTMKITNNIYVNFDSLQYSDNTVVRHIYINMNIKKNNDLIHTTDTVNEIINLLDGSESTC